MHTFRYAAVKWRSKTANTKPVLVYGWYVTDNEDDIDPNLSHPAGFVLTFDLGKGKHAQVVLSRSDLAVIAGELGLSFAE